MLCCESSWILEKQAIICEKPGASGWKTARYFLAERSREEFQPSTTGQGITIPSQPHRLGTLKRMELDAKRG